MKISIKTPFGLLATFNLVLMPLHISVLFRDYYFKYSTKIILNHWMMFGFAILIFGGSIYFYLREINVQKSEHFFRGRKLEVSEGDVMFLNFLRKPAAFFLQIMLLMYNALAIFEIFGIK